MTISRKIFFFPRGLFARTCLVFFLFFAIFLLFHSLTDGFFSGDDPYYHAKHSWLIAQTGDWKLVKPWIEFHWLSYAPTDPWWGYHLLGALTAKFFGLVWGAKVLAAFFAALALAVFYFIASRLGARSPIFWTFLFFTSSYVFLFRLFLERPFLAAISFSLLSYFFLGRKKYAWLFFLSLFYILFYNLGLLVILSAAVFTAAEFFYTRQINLKPLLSSTAGTAVGLLIHPAFLNYLYLISLHLWQIFYLRFSGINLSIGGEVSQWTFADFFKDNFIALVIFIFSFSLFIAFYRQISADKKRVFYLSLFLLSSFWFLASCLIPRAVEYWLPAALLFSALIFSFFFRQRECGEIFNYLRRHLEIKIIYFFLLACLFIIAGSNIARIFIFIGARESESAREYYFSQANLWLNKNTAPESVVFYSNWGFWPVMFFYNDHNRYVAGMDPTFFYEYDPKLFWLWQNLSREGYNCDQPLVCPASPREQFNSASRSFKERLKIQYLLLLKELDSPLLKIANQQKKNFLKVYENQEMAIFQVN